MKEHPESAIKRFASCKFGEIAISSITWGELCCGLNTRNSRKQMDALFVKIVAKPFDIKAAEVFGHLSQDYPGRRNSFDRMIAAHALSLDAVLVTNNVADFVVYQAAGLRMENWADSCA
jgi:tRNA(fMet)-specific endonuclease VapC